MVVLLYLGSAVFILHAVMLARGGLRVIAMKIAALVAYWVVLTLLMQSQMR